MKSPVESNYHPIGSASPSDGPRGMKNLLWEERYQRLQMLLKKLDESDQEEYVQSMLYFAKANLFFSILPVIKFYNTDLQIALCDFTSALVTFLG